jgi:hypothetical protein
MPTLDGLKAYSCGGEETLPDYHTCARQNQITVTNALFAQYIGHSAQDKRLSKALLVMWFTVAS